MQNPTSYPHKMVNQLLARGAGILFGSFLCFFENRNGRFSELVRLDLDTKSNMRY
jgi:hypothetical protein